MEPRLSDQSVPDSLPTSRARPRVRPAANNSSRKRRFRRCPASAMIMSTTAQTIRRFQASSQNQPNSPGSSLTRFVMAVSSVVGPGAGIERTSTVRTAPIKSTTSVGRRALGASLAEEKMRMPMPRCSRGATTGEPSVSGSGAPAPCVTASDVPMRPPGLGRSARSLGAQEVGASPCASGEPLPGRLEASHRPASLLASPSQDEMPPWTRVRVHEPGDRSVPLNRHVRPMPPSTQRSRRPWSARRSGRRSRCGGSAPARSRTR